jgi:ATP-dependent RNA helicase DDX19/DBP5
VGVLANMLVHIRFVPKTAQIAMFSATFPPALVEFAKTLAPKANVITLENHQIPLENIRQIFIDVDSADEKYQKIVDMYKCLEIGSSIIFCAKRITADQIQARLQAEGHKTVSLHSALESPEHRDAVIQRFVDGKAKVCWASNERG